MKKFFATLILLMMISATCAATQFQITRPSLSVNFFSDACEIGGHTVKPADKAKLFPDLYFHYDTAKNFGRLGDFDVSNSVAVDMQGQNEITFVENLDGGAEFFAVKKNTPPGDTLTVIGKRDGIWVEYLNARSLRIKYDIGWNFVMSKIIAHGDKIIFRYTLQEDVIDIVCTWNAANQNFSTEAIER